MAFALQILFSFSLFMIFVCCYSIESHRKTFDVRVSVHLHQSVLLECSGVYVPGRKWEFEDNTLYAGRSFRGKVLGENFTLYDNYSLFISSMSFQYEGRYTCKQNESEVVSSYYLQVEVPPRLCMTIDGVRTSNETHQIDSSKPLFVACYADGARPAVNLTWLVNNKVLDSSNVVHEVSSPDNNFTFDTVTLAQFRIKDEDGIISCEGSYSYAHSKFVVQANFVTYVLPIMKISVLGSNRTNNISVTADEEVFIICAANGARPSINLTWIAEGIIEREEDRLKESLFNVSFHADTNTYNSYSEVRYLPYEGRQIVSCVGENAFGVKERCSLTLIGYGKHGDQPSRFIILLLVVAALTILVVLGVCLPIIRYKLFRGTQVSMNISEGEASKEHTPNSEKTDPTLTDAVPLEDKTHAVSLQDKTDALSLEDKTDAVSLEDKTDALSLEDKTGVAEDNVRPPNLNLPKIPVVTAELSEYSCEPTEKRIYYSEPKEKTTKDRIFQRKNICFILPLKMGQLCKRWVGTIDVPKKDQKRVVISTVTDSILHDNCINWSAFLQRVLELPDTDYLVKVEGICVDTVSLYLLHEHLVCETLESYLVFHETSCGAAEKLHFMKKCLLDIIKGMEHIQAFGFLHPGISIQKILVTQKGTCKLYDYCLAEDAPKKLVFMKSQTKRSVSSFPPEALQRNEYTKESDVWSLASIMSTMTVNDLYFGYEDDIGGSEVYQRLRNNVLVDCLSTDPKLRLTVTQLRSCFEEVVQSSQEGRVPGSPATDPVDAYVPMKANITTKKETYI